jgi:iron uptake system component EfeO
MGWLRLRETLIGMAVVGALALGAGCGSSGEGAATAQSGISDAELEYVERDALLRYQWYLEVEAERLLKRAEGLRKTILANSVSGAQLKYAAARIPYVHTEPVARTFEKLRLRIDAQEGEAAGDRFTGFHRLEKGLFGKESTNGLSGVATQLVDDLGELSKKIEAGELRPHPVAESAAELMEEISTTWIGGKVEPYAAKDVADVSAGVEAAEKAFETVRPLLASTDPALVARLEAKFVETYERLEEHGGPAREFPTRKKGVGWNFSYYSEYQPEEIREMAVPLQGLAKLFAEVPQRLPSEDEFGF